MKKYNLAIFASGSGTNAVNLIKTFKDEVRIDISVVVSNKQDAPVLKKSIDLGVESLFFTNKHFADGSEILNVLEDLGVTHIILAGFLRKIAPSYLEKFNNKIINIHPALLPNYGGKGMYGMAVHKAVISNKEKESGITIHLINENYDEGEFLGQFKCQIEENDTPESLASKIHELEYEFYPKVIKNFLLK